MTRPAICLIAILLLAGCASDQLAVRVERREVPPSLLSCAAEPPAPPDAELRTQRDAALHFEAVRSAGRECRDNLAAVRGLLGSE